MTQKEVFRIVVGLMILGSLALGAWATRYALLFTTFIGLNMLQSAFTGFCPLDILLRKAGLVGCPEARERVRY